MRVVIDGVQNSPLYLGTLQLDRASPNASHVSLTPAGGAVTAQWTQGDDLSGTDPASPVIAEVNASPAGDSSGAWVAFAQQPDPGDGMRTARTDLRGLTDGPHLVRVRSTDRAGNSGAATLGTALADHTRPVVTGARLTRPVRVLNGLADVAFTADDGTGAGLNGAVRVAPAGAGIDVDWSSPGAPGPGHVMVQAPTPGVHVVTVRVSDAVGNWGESAPVAIRFPNAAEAADATANPPPAIAADAGATPRAGVAWAFGQARRFARGRGLRLGARVRVGRTRAEWRRMLGPSSAARYAGYSTLDGRILLGPGVTRSLESLATTRRGAIGAPSRADLDEQVQALAVLLHESIHETGPRAREDALGTRSGRAFEEGFAEAATLDLLPSFVAGLRLPPEVRAGLMSAVGRYRPAYRSEVAWARRLSAGATRSAAGSRRARAWRIRVADRWGGDRWELLAAATGREEAALRAEATAGGRPGRLR